MSTLRIVLALLVILTMGIASGFAAAASNSSQSSAVSGDGVVAGGSIWPAPVVTSFAVSPTLAAPGEFVNFTWSSAHATAFAVTPEIAQDDMTLPAMTTSYSYNTNGLAKTTTFKAVAGSGSNASAPLSTTLIIIPVTLTASTANIHAGQSVTFRYNGPNNNSTSWALNISGGNPSVPLTPQCSGDICSGIYQTGPLAATTAFSVSMTGPAPTGGQAFSPNVIVNVQDSTTLTLSTQSQTAQAGAAVALSWRSANASSITIDGVGELQPVASGSYCCVHPTKTTTYTATAMPIYPGAPPIKATARVTVSTGDLSNLNHIIFLLQENRSFDNYFGKLAEYRVNHQPSIPGAQLSDVNDLHTLPSDFQLCNPNDFCVPSFHARSVCTENMIPNWYSSHFDMHLEINDWLHLTQNSVFLMDRFLKTGWSDQGGGQYDTQHTRPLGYYDQTDLPFYYELATQFTTDDSWYSPLPANTIPNRMYLFAGTSYGHGEPPTNQNDPAWQRPTIFRALTAKGISWRYYYQDNSVFLAQWADWNDPKIQGNVRNIQEYYNILSSPDADQLLPQVIFIERATSTHLDEHPLENIQTGAAQVEKLINALFKSAAWPDSAFILTYDEGGGLFDHAPPILVTPPDDISPRDLQPWDFQGFFNVTGFRVPVVVVSPWSKPQTVIHLQTDYTSILKLIEDRFNVPPLTQRDATIADMADPQNGFFDFSAPHLLEVPPLPTQPITGTCDYNFGGYKYVQIFRH